MKKWPEKSYQWYANACDYFNYPAVPYGTELKSMVINIETVLDLGCGIGAASLMLSPLCGYITAIDQDEKALTFLREKARERNINNIQTICRKFPDDKLKSADIVIVMHVAKTMSTSDNIKLVYEAANKGGFIACQAPVAAEEESFLELKKELALPLFSQTCGNGCFVKGALEALGAKVSCEMKTYQFGQPLDTYEEVIQFISWQTGADDAMTDIVKKYSHQYAEKDGDKYIVPMTRHSCGICFVK